MYTLPGRASLLLSSLDQCLHTGTRVFGSQEHSAGVAWKKVDPIFIVLLTCPSPPPHTHTLCHFSCQPWPEVDRMAFLCYKDSRLDQWTDSLALVLPNSSLSCIFHIIIHKAICQLELKSIFHTVRHLAPLGTSLTCPRESTTNSVDLNWMMSFVCFWLSGVV